MIVAERGDCMSITLDSPSVDIAKIASPDLAEPRIPLTGISWEQYETMIAMVGDRPRLRLSYLDGTLEIMTISPEHEMIKKMIARLLEVYALEADIALYSYGSATFRRRAATKGLEADESYCLDDRKDVPDLAIELSSRCANEVVLSSGTIDKMQIYAGLGVLEVWVWQAGSMIVQRLRSDGSGYDAFVSSVLLPQLDLGMLAEYIRPQDEPQALRAFRNLIREQIQA
jgi:Uma2 family endonuclease